jgi:biopolymer transport protein TolR
MAFTTNSGGGGRNSRYRPLSEINVTPLVDVMLVLLIIFMVTAPLMTSGVSVDLPKTNAQPLNSDSEPLTVTIKADGSIFLQDQAIDISDIVAKLQAIAKDNADRRIFVRGDKDLAYGRIMEVMGTITQGGFTKVALLAEQTAVPQNGVPQNAAHPVAAPQNGTPQNGTLQNGAPQNGTPQNAAGSSAAPAKPASGQRR